MKHTSSASAGDPLVLATAANDSYVMPLAVMLYTALLHHDASGRSVEIYVLDGGITPDYKHRIERLLSPFEVTLTWLLPPAEKLHGLKAVRQYPIASYFRLFLADLLPTSYRKLLFIDPDCIIVEDVEKLWDLDCGENIVLAVQDKVNPVLEMGLLNWRELGLPRRGMYFNSGVLLMDLDRWRQGQIGEKVVEYVRNNAEYVRFADQDGLNAVLHGQWQPLDRRWNAFPSTIDREALAGVPRAELVDRLKTLPDRPYLIHMAGYRKPWNARLKHPVQHIYFQYLQETGLLTPAEWRRFMMRMAVRRMDVEIRILIGPWLKTVRQARARRRLADEGPHPYPRTS